MGLLSPVVVCVGDGVSILVFKLSTGTLIIGYIRDKYLPQSPK